MRRLLPAARRFLPQTLPSWSLIILIAGLATTQIATLYIVSRDRTASNQMLELFGLRERAYALVSLLGPEPSAERQRLAANLSSPSRPVSVSDEPDIDSPIPSDDVLAELEDVLVARLGKFGVVDARISRAKAAPFDPSESPPRPSDDVGDIDRRLADLAASFKTSGRLLTSIQFNDGQWLNFLMPLTPQRPIITAATLPLYVAVAGLVILLSIWAMWRLTAPYRALERAVENFGDNPKSPPLPETGGREYRSAARAVNMMRARLGEYIADREQLAAALAHDLRTPLTRMRLRLEQLKSPIRHSIARDIDEIEAITRSVVDFATNEVVDEPVEKIDLWALVDSIADSYPRASFDDASIAHPGLICRARPTALKRCIANLVENAITYGQRAHIGLAATQTELIMTIRDEGPGIPAERLDSVFRPFTRMEASRNRSTGGVGLGLTIARNVARSSGGDVTLSNDPSGGLRTELRLPRLMGGEARGATFS
jgi:signal transduction histidine kinase